MFKRKAFHFAVEHRRPFKVADFEYEYDGKPIQRRPSQLESNKVLQDTDFALDWRPTGSGKGYAIRFSAIHNARKDKNLRIIIAAPSIQVCRDFSDTPMELDFGKGIHRWNPSSSTVNDNCNQSIQHIIEFLTRPVSSVAYNDRILITTHAALVRAHAKSPKSFRNVLIYIDEAHHILYDTDEEDRTPEETLEWGMEQNQLGKLVETALKNRDARIRLHFSTATYNRGDKLNIIPPKYAHLFAQYTMPFSKYLSEECQYLESFTYSFNLYKDQPLESLIEEFKTFRKTICYIASGEPTEKGDKVMDYLMAISQSKSPVWKNNKDGSITVLRGKEKLTGVVLVEEEGRSEKYKYIGEAHRGKVPLDFIIALRTFIEGANWKQAEKLIIIGYKRSITDIMQRVGRLTRDHKDKRHVEVVHIMEQPFEDQERNVSEESLSKYNDYLKTIILILEQMPVVFRNHLPLPRGRRNHPERVEDVPNLLMEVVGNNHTYDTIQEELSSKLFDCFTGVPEGTDWVEEFKLDAESILEEHGIDQKRISEIVENFLVRSELMRRRVMEINAPPRREGVNADLGADVSDYDFNVLSEHKYVGHLLYLMANKVDQPFLSALREVVRNPNENKWEVMYQASLERHRRKMAA